MSMTEESPWNTFDITINLVILFIAIGLSTAMLVLKALWIYLGIYYLCWGLYIIVGRYVTCRHCDFLGKPCPSWFMGMIAGKLYKRSDKPNFCADGGFRNALLFDISFLLIAVLIPLIAYIIEALTGTLLALEWTLFAIYLIIALLMLIIHSLTGCRKCPIADCPMSRKHKFKKPNAL